MLTRQEAAICVVAAKIWEQCHFKLRFAFEELARRKIENEGNDDGVCYWMAVEREVVHIARRNGCFTRKNVA